MKHKIRPPLLRPSARAFVREARRTPGVSLLDTLHGYVYGRWVYLYLAVGGGHHWLGRLLGPVVKVLARLIPTRPPEGSTGTFADGYHGKVLPLEAASQLVSVKQDVRLTDLEHIIPYVRARDIVLQHPDHIVAVECPCRTLRADPCLPLDVCLVVGEPFASFVVEHHPGRSRWITAQEAVEILRAEDARGHAHHAFFKDAMLGRFYGICNCCACCCGAVRSHHGGTPMLAASGYVCRLEAELCIGCDLCTDFCQFYALSVKGDVAVVDAEACMGCGVCVSQCAQGALSLVRDPAKGEPLEIYKLIERAASA
jgi:ferredoxin